MSKFATLAPQQGGGAHKSPARTGLLRGQTTPGISGNGLKKSFKEVLEGQLSHQTEMPQSKKMVKNAPPSAPKRLGLSTNLPTEARTGLSHEYQLNKKPSERLLNTSTSQSGLEVVIDPRTTPLEQSQNRPGLRPTRMSPSRVEGSALEQNNPKFHSAHEPKSTSQTAITVDANNEKVKLTLVDRRQMSQRATNSAISDQKFVHPKQENTPNNDFLTNRQLAGTNQEGGEVLARVETAVARQGHSQAVVQTRTVQVPPAFYQQLHSEFLDRAKLILKDGGGEMRLTLRPQNLGSLRLSVSLEERVLKGQIVVDNETVRTLVESQLDSLLRSFREDGFTPLELRVSVAGEDGRRNASQEQQQQFYQENQPFENETFKEQFERQNHFELEA